MAVAGPLRLAVLPDYREEGWRSMDLCADMLLANVGAVHDGAVHAERVQPPYRQPFSILQGRFGSNANRLLNRHWTYPRHVRRLRPHFDAFHLIDHSYAQLVHALPAERTGVYCHDLDTFRCLVEPNKEPRSRWFKAVVRRTLRGLQKAAVVFHTTMAVRSQIESFGLVDPARLIHAPNGVSPEFTAEDGTPDDPANEPFLLHVGTGIPRKRIDVLLAVFAVVRAGMPGLRLVQIGAQWSAEQSAQLQRLGLNGSVEQFHRLSRGQLAGLYRRAAVVLQPSEAEGFGLPVIEALACGAAVVASDIPVLREVGGAAAIYQPVADVAAWAEAVSRLLADPGAAPPRSVRLAQARPYTWQAQAATIAAAYLRLVGRAVP